MSLSEIEMIGLCFLLSAAGILAFPILVTFVRTLVVLIRNLFVQYWKLVDRLVEKAWQLHARLEKKSLQLARPEDLQRDEADTLTKNSA